VRAVVLVGGLGTRLRPLTYTTPKNLLPVVEVPIIERVVAWLAAYGVDSVVLSMGYRPAAFTAAYPDGTVCGVPVHYAVEPVPLDTGGAIGFAAADAGIDETFVVVNGDVLTDTDVGAQIARHRGTGALATIALTPVEDPSRFGVVVTDSGARVTAFIEKPPPGEAPSNFVNAGTYVLEPEVLRRIPAGAPMSMERAVFPALAADASLFAVASDRYWLDVGLPDSYLQAAFDLLSPGVRPGPPAPGATEMGPSVWVLGAPLLGDGVVAAAGPGTLFGHRAEVAAGARVEAGVVGSGARVGAGAVVRRSVLLSGAVVGPGAVVEDSIVGPGARVGEGAKLGGMTVLGATVEVEAGAVLDGARWPA
jgi:NDP-sugar pyrophosphorylase family protein